MRLGDDGERISDPAGPLAEDGRGVLIVTVLADEWGVEKDRDGTTTWFRLGHRPRLRAPRRAAECRIRAADVVSGRQGTGVPAAASRSAAAAFVVSGSPWPKQTISGSSVASRRKDRAA